MNENDVGESTSQCAVGLVDADGWRLASCADEDLALTLFAVASEDPATWQEIAAYWPRYRTPAVAEFADGTVLVSADQSNNGPHAGRLRINPGVNSRVVG